MSNPRTRGKIAHSEWPKIAARVAMGESLAAVARSYRCTAPAIRYIVRRTPDGRQRIGGGGEEGSHVKANFLPAIAGRREDSPPRSSAAPNGALDEVLWSRVSSGIAAFLSALDALMTEHTVDNEHALLSATDDLLRATARTRVEIEKAIGGRRRPLEQRAGDEPPGVVLDGSAKV